MSQSPETQSIIEKAVAEVLDKALPRLRAEIVRHTSEQLQALATFSGPSSSELLNVATSSIQEASSQAEILRQLLEGSARFAGRAAVFVARGGAMSGWQGIGFDNDFLKSVSLNGASGVAAQAMQSRLPASGRASEFDSAFLASAGKPADDHCLVLPLVVKDKVAALVYADSGTSGGSLDGAALSVLIRCASLWLELVALRKVDGVSAEESQASMASPPPPATLSVAAPTSSASTQAHAAAPAASGEAELHRKAKRFAKLLVEEIKLYNQPKVTEGRQQRDLYERLKEDIEKSRATYDKRYGESPVASANYFTEELIRILADNDVTLMGASFPR